MIASCSSPFSSLAAISIVLLVGVESTQVSRTERVSIKTIDLGVSGIKESLEDKVSFGFASDCELAIAQDFCIADEGKNHPFCSQGLLDRCVSLRPSCLGFEIDRCSPDIECCECSFVDCPLTETACGEIEELCFYADFASLKLEEKEVDVLRQIFHNFDKDGDSMLSFNETMTLIEKAEGNSTVPRTLASRASSKNKKVEQGKIIINERTIEQITVKDFGVDDFHKMCVSVKENPTLGVSLGTFLKIYAKHHGWFYRHIQRLFHHEQYAIKRKDGCSSTALVKEALDAKIADGIQKRGGETSDTTTHSRLAEDPCKANLDLKLNEEQQDNDNKNNDNNKPQHIEEELSQPEEEGQAQPRSENNNKEGSFFSTLENYFSQLLMEL